MTRRNWQRPSASPRVGRVGHALVLKPAARSHARLRSGRVLENGRPAGAHAGVPARRANLVQRRSAGGIAAGTRLALQSRPDSQPRLGRASVAPRLGLTEDDPQFCRTRPRPTTKVQSAGAGSRLRGRCAAFARQGHADRGRSLLEHACENLPAPRRTSRHRPHRGAAARRGHLPRQRGLATGRRPAGGALPPPSTPSLAWLPRASPIRKSVTACMCPRGQCRPISPMSSPSWHRLPRPARSRGDPASGQRAR